MRGTSLSTVPLFHNLPHHRLRNHETAYQETAFETMGPNKSFYLFKLLVLKGWKILEF